MPMLGRSAARGVRLEGREGPSSGLGQQAALGHPPAARGGAGGGRIGLRVVGRAWPAPQSSDCGRTGHGGGDADRLMA
eukprot:8540652-Pyramimonas_sp.AAC.1